MSLKCGIVGLPNVGKSTIFNAITQAGVQSANYPFCTIEPNLGLVDVPDDRLDQIATKVKPQRVVRAVTEFVDIAGLVEGASKGEGLGNKFLSHIRQTQAIVHVVRCFDDTNVVHVRGKVAPEEDISIIQTELSIADLESLTRQSEKLRKKLRSNDKEAKELLPVAEKLLASLEAGDPVRGVALSADEKKLSDNFQLITQRPVLYVCNVDESAIVNQVGNEHTKKVQALAQQEGDPVIYICGKTEEELIALDQEERMEYLSSLQLKKSGLERMILASYELLGLLTFFTAGEEEVRAWTIANGCFAAQAAGEIHTDIEQGFICGEVLAYDDFIHYGSLLSARKNGKMRLEGKDYLVQDGDIVHFRFNKTVRQGRAV